MRQESRHEIKQRIRERRGNFKKERKKKFQSLKNRGIYTAYREQKAGIQIKKVSIRDDQMVGPPKPSWASKIKSFIKHVKNFLQSLWKRNGERRTSRRPDEKKRGLPHDTKPGWKGSGNI